VDSHPELGRYRILGEVGRGSSGTVFRALDTLIGREVAIKSFHAPAGGPSPESLRDELLREARSVGMLSHPHVVTVYDVAEGADGSWFMAMEYVEGRSLAEILAEDGPPDFERTVDWISQIASALDYLHTMGLIHRDVKPANVLVTAAGQVKLTDFGIASPGRGEPAGDDDAVLGTPSYMAPEQILGRENTPRSDVWSLAAVLHEMLTGRRAFEGRTVAEVVHRVVHAPVPESPEGSGHPAGVWALLERALAKDPHWRFASAGELARELRRILYRAAGEVGDEDLSDADMLDRTLVTAPSGAGAATKGVAPRRRATSKGVALRGGIVTGAVLLALLLGLGAILAHRALAPEESEPAGEEEAAALPADGRSGEAAVPAADSDRGEPSAAPVAAAPAPAPRVRVEFTSEAPEGVLTIYAGGEELLRRGFSYYEPGGLLGRRPSSGGFQEEVTVPAGVDAFQVSVARPDVPARRLEVPGRVRPGDGRVLRIHLPTEGEATAAWEPGAAERPPTAR
jgi:serine/threonine-protein kinase